MGLVKGFSLELVKLFSMVSILQFTRNPPDGVPFVVVALAGGLLYVGVDLLVHRLQKADRERDQRLSPAKGTDEPAAAKN